MRRRPEDGFVTTEFVLGVAVLLLPMVILVSLVPRWSEASLAASTAADAGAQAAAVAFATGADWSEAVSRGRVAGQSVLATHGMVGAVDVRVDTVRAEATVTVALHAFPVLSPPDTQINRGREVPSHIAGLHATATATRLIDPFRAPEATSIRRIDPFRAPEAAP